MSQNDSSQNNLNVFNYFDLNNFDFILLQGQCV